MTFLNDIVAAMTTGGTLDLEFDYRLNDHGPGSLEVYLSAGATADSVRVSRRDIGESATILWLPWRQGNLPSLRPNSVARAPQNTLFLTYVLSGCKLFAIRGGPVWHIDAPIRVDEFWPQILNDEWVEDNWPPGEAQYVAYLHRAGQQAALWDLTGRLQGGGISTYGDGNVGDARVGGLVNGDGQLDLYYRASPWASLRSAEGTRKK